MKREEILERVSGVLAEVLGRECIELRPGMTARDIEGWDSMNHIRIVLSVEEAFNVQFSMAEIPELQNIDEFVDLICAKLA